MFGKLHRLGTFKENKIKEFKFKPIKSHDQKNILLKIDSLCLTNIAFYFNVVENKIYILHQNTQKCFRFYKSCLFIYSKNLKDWIQLEANEAHEITCGSVFHAKFTFLYSRNYTVSLNPKLCPITLSPLQSPHFFSACGHIFSFSKKLATFSHCPVCRTKGNLTKMLVILSSLWTETLELVILPCRHGITAQFKDLIQMCLPVYKSGLRFRRACPFCFRKIKEIKKLF